MLPSFEGESLAALLANPEWAYAIGQAGFDPNKCEVVLRVSEVLVGSGGVPESGRPAILMGQGDRIALAFPAEREVKVSSRDKHRAEIQTTRSGSFQIVFGNVENLNVFGFWGSKDQLSRGTIEGQAFGSYMTMFLRGQLRPGQIFGTPQGIATLVTESVDKPHPGAERVLITPDLMREARQFMESWTHIVGQAPDEIFWPALERFGHLGGATQGAALLAIQSQHELQRTLDQPWQTWANIGHKALESGDLELTVWVFLFAYVMVEQVGFDANITARCGFREPGDQTYHQIASQALAAADQAPQGWTVVERAIAPPTTKEDLQTGLRGLLGQ